jgi:hypothetical protein
VSDATSLLFDLPGFRVVSCEEVDTGGRRAVIMQTADEHACPRCGVLTLLLGVTRAAPTRPIAASRSLATSCGGNMR